MKKDLRQKGRGAIKRSAGAQREKRRHETTMKRRGLTPQVQEAQPGRSGKQEKQQEEGTQRMELHHEKGQGTDKRKKSQVRETTSNPAMIWSRR